MRFPTHPNVMQQPEELTLPADNQTSLQSMPTLVEASLQGPDPDDLWAQALQQALRKLPSKDSQWLADKQNQKAFTSTEIVEEIQPFQEKYTNHPAQRFLTRIDPIVSHVRSFAGAITAMASADRTGAGVLWGSVYLVLIVRQAPLSDQTDGLCANSQKQHRFALSGLGGSGKTQIALEYTYLPPSG